MKPKTERGKRKLPSDTRLFRFTEEDEVRMITAMESSVRFMRKYGKGRQPYTLVTNYSNYN